MVYVAVVSTGQTPKFQFEFGDKVRYVTCARNILI